MRRVSLGRTGLEVSQLCFGTLTMAPMQQNLSPDEGARLLLYAYEQGVNFLDTADLYDTYPHIRRALIAAPDYIVSTKAYCYDAPTARAALERAFRGLGRDYVDLFMLHEQESRHTLRGHAEALTYLADQKRRGHIGAVGISTHFAECVKDALRFPEIDVIHPLINIEGIGIQGGSREDMETNIKIAHDGGRGILAMKALGGGHLIASSHDALKYIADAPWADAAAIGMQSKAEIDANVALFSGAPEARALLHALKDKQRRILVHDWCEGCGRCKDACGMDAISLSQGKARIDPESCVFCGYCARACPQVCIKVV
ncbi:MAG: aldo/keto reductase [Christensenellales bacterium]|jgi:aryl-alcohol dehydrogenase-like predicted oxidoreductase